MKSGNDAASIYTSAGYNECLTMAKTSSGFRTPLPPYSKQKNEKLHTGIIYIITHLCVSNDYDGDSVCISELCRIGKASSLLEWVKHQKFSPLCS